MAKEGSKKEPSIIFGLMFFILMFTLVITNATITFMQKHPITSALIQEIQNSYVKPADNFYNSVGFTLMSKILDSQFQKYLKNANIAMEKENSLECAKINHKYNTFQVIGSYFGMENNKDYCGAVNAVNANLTLNNILFLSGIKYFMIVIYFVIFVLLVVFFMFYRKISKVKDVTDSEVLQYFAFIPPLENKSDAEAFLKNFITQNPIQDQTKKQKTIRTIIDIDKLRDYVHSVMNGNYQKIASNFKSQLQNNSEMFQYAQMSANLLRYMSSSVNQEKDMTCDPYPASITGHHNPDADYGLLTHSLHVAYLTILNTYKQDDFANSYLKNFYAAICHDLSKIRNYRQRKAMPQEIIDAIDVSGENIKDKMAKIAKEKENEWVSYKLDETAQTNIFIQLSTKVFPDEKSKEIASKCDKWAIETEIMFTGLAKGERHKVLENILESIFKYKNFSDRFVINQVVDKNIDVFCDNGTGVTFFGFHDNFFAKLSKILEDEFKNKRLPYKTILQIPIFSGKENLQKMFQFFFWESAKENNADQTILDLIAEKRIVSYGGVIINGEFTIALGSGIPKLLNVVKAVENEFTIM